MYYVSHVYRFIYHLPNMSELFNDAETKNERRSTPRACSELQIERIDQMTQIQKNALELFTRKNADYGDAFAKYGVIGVLMRIEDKIQRCLSITKSGVQLVNDESIRDTLLDLHNYAAMALMLLDE